MSRSQVPKKRPSSLRAELVWEGKYDSNGAVSMSDGGSSEAPLRVVESFGARTRATTPARNLLIHGDNRRVMIELMDRFRGRIDLIYIDPPFDAGIERTARVPVGKRSRAASASYKDRWGSGAESYLQMMYERLTLMRELLSERGSIYVHCDYRASGFLRVMLDEIFGRENFVNEIIWFYKTGGLPEKLGFGRKHDTIHFYAKSRAHAIWHPQKEKSYLMHKYGFSNIEILEDKRGRYTEVNCRDVFDIPALRGNQPERVDYPTQKPEALIERIIRASSNQGSLVADFFCGSGTTGVVAERLGRRWILCDRERMAVHTTRKRLIEVGRSQDEPVPFDIADTSPPAEAAGRIDVEPVYRKLNGKCVVDVRLKGFVPSMSDLPAGRKKTADRTPGNGIDLVDYWAVDFESDGRTFVPDWMDFRSRSDRTLETISDIGYGYAEPGTHAALVRVIDIFGRDVTVRMDVVLDAARRTDLKS